MLRAEQAAGKTIFMSSHVLSEVEALCGRVGIIRDGLLVEVNEVEALRQNRVKRVEVTFRGAPPDVGGSAGAERDSRPTATACALPTTARCSRCSRPWRSRIVQDLTVNDPSLEEVFRAFYQNGPGRRGPWSMRAFWSLCRQHLRLYRLTTMIWLGLSP